MFSQPGWSAGTRAVARCASADLRQLLAVRGKEVKLFIILIFDEFVQLLSAL